MAEIKEFVSSKAVRSANNNLKYERGSVPAGSWTTTRSASTGVFTSTRDAQRVKPSSIIENSKVPSSKR